MPVQTSLIRLSNGPKAWVAEEPEVFARISPHLCECIRYILQTPIRNHSKWHAPALLCFSEVPRSVDWLEGGAEDANCTFREGCPRMVNAGLYWGAGKDRVDAFLRVFSRTSRNAS